MSSSRREDLRFGLLYLICLMLCLGGVEWLEGRAPAAEAAIVTEVAATMAIPPKPEGAQVPDSALQGEGSGQRYTEAVCQRYEGDTRDACFHTLALQRAAQDPEGGLLACGSIQRDALSWECQADVAELHAAVDLEAAEALCPDIPRKKWRDQCRFGLALSQVKLDRDRARALCLEAGMWRDFCFHDVNGEIAQLDPPDALAWCDREQGDLLRRKTCYHGLGKYLGRTDPQQAWALCEQVPRHETLYPENCHHGIGWALAEAQGEAAVQSCPRSGDYADSCRLGVSAWLKPSSPEAAVRICESVQRRDLRARCLDFIAR